MHGRTGRHLCEARSRMAWIMLAGFKFHRLPLDKEHVILCSTSRYRWPLGNVLVLLLCGVVLFLLCSAWVNLDDINADMHSRESRGERRCMCGCPPASPPTRRNSSRRLIKLVWALGCHESSHSSSLPASRSRQRQIREVPENGSMSGDGMAWHSLFCCHCNVHVEE